MAFIYSGFFPSGTYDEDADVIDVIIRAVYYTLDYYCLYDEYASIDGDELNDEYED